MATTNSAASDSVKLNGSVFTADRVVNSFLRHEVVKLDEGTFLQWKKQVQFIVNGYDFFGFLDGSVSAPSRFVQAPDGTLVLNPAASVFTQQDNLTTSWLLCTISSTIISSFMDVQSTSEVWTTALAMFAADTDLQQERLRHELHSLKKGSLSIRQYVAKLKSLCAHLEASGTSVSVAERTAVMLAGLPSKFEGVVSSTSLSLTPLPFQRLVDALIECETHHVPPDQEVLYSANMVEESSLPASDGSVRGGRSPMRGRGRNFRPRLQCQICSRFSHVAQRCYYRYHRDEASPMHFLMQNVCASGDRGWSSPPNTQPRVSNFGQNYCADGFDGFSAPYVEPMGGGPRPNIESHEYRPQPLGPNGGWLRPIVENHEYRPHTLGPNGGGTHGAVTGKFGPRDGVRPTSNIGLNDSLLDANPVLNNVQIDSSKSVDGFGVPWQTKPRARVFSASNPCFGLPRLGDLHASDYSDPSVSGSLINSAQCGVSGDGSDSPIPRQAGTTSWYPDSGASNHVCQDDSVIRDAVPYSAWHRRFC